MPTRRRQARSETSRERILLAVIACIEREGFAGATATAIAREAGLSVGAVQHHFPSKDDVFDAVMQESAARFAACFDNECIALGSTGDRVDEFIRRAWRHYGSSFFRAAQEIVLGGRRGRDPQSPALRASARVGERVWRGVFGDLPLSTSQHRDLRRYAFGALTGLALMARYEPEARRIAGPLESLGVGLQAAIDHALAARSNAS